MPIIIQPGEMKTSRSGEGWTETTLADGSTFGGGVMVARRWSLEANALGPTFTHRDGTEGMLYVIGGEGVAIVGSQRLPLKRESVLWLEAGETYQLEAGPNGLEVLQGYAPGEPT